MPLSNGVVKRSELDTAGIQEILDRIDGLPSALRQTIVDELWSEIPTYVDEYAYVPVLAAGGTLTVAPATTTAETISNVVVSVPAGALGVVTLAGQSFPVPAGVQSIGGVHKVLGPSDLRTLTITGAAGPAGLWLTGQQAPTFGVVG